MRRLFLLGFLVLLPGCTGLKAATCVISGPYFGEIKVCLDYADGVVGPPAADGGAK